MLFDIIRVNAGNIGPLAFSDLLVTVHGELTEVGSLSMRRNLVNTARHGPYMLDPGIIVHDNSSKRRASAPLIASSTSCTSTIR